MSVAVHRLPLEIVRSFARGPVQLPTIRLLMRGQLSRHALLLREVLLAARAHPEVCQAAQLDRAVAAFDTVQRVAPTSAAEVLAYPFVGAWAAHCLRRLRSAHPDDGDVPLWVDLAHLNAVAGAAAVRADVSVDVDLVARDGFVALPGLGRARVPGAASYGVASLARDDSWWLVGLHGRTPLSPPGTASSGAAGHWEPVHVWHLGTREDPIVVVLDDVDPYRDCYRLEAAGRVGGAELARWYHLVEQAWQVLHTRHPVAAHELAAHPVVVMPLAGVPGGPGMTATARDSTLAVAMSPPHDPVGLAQSLVHEFQHSKLGALLDLVDLVDLDDRRRVYSPWRADPRPLSGVLQAVFAFVAVAEFWAAELESGHAGNAPLALYTVARTRRQLITATRTLQESRALTGVGEEFVAELKEAVYALNRVDVPDRLEAFARIVNDHHRLAWRLRNLRVDGAALDRLERAMLAGESPRDLVPPDRSLLRAAPRYDEQPLDELARLSLADALVHTRSTRNATGGWPGDRALLRGDYAAAAEAFLAELAAGNAGIASWAGLAAARTRFGPAPAIGSFSRHPELVAQLWARLVHRPGRAAPSPDDVAVWLGS